MSLSEKRMKASKEIEHDSSQSGDRMSDPDRFDTSCGDGAATLADSPDSLSEQLISRSTAGSSSLSPAFSHSAKSPSFRADCVDPFGGSATLQMLLKWDEKDWSSTSFDREDDFRSSRWNSGRWSGGKTSLEDGSSERLPPRKGACKCAARLTADVAVVCCCPLSLLHLLTIALVKFPKAVVSKTATTLAANFLAAKRKRAAALYEEELESISGASCHASRCRSYEAGRRSYESRRTQIWSAMPAFGDQKMWRDCNFDSPDTCVSIDGDPLRGKS